MRRQHCNLFTPIIALVFYWRGCLGFSSARLRRSKSPAEPRSLANAQVFADVRGGCDDEPLVEFDTAGQDAGRTLLLLGRSNSILKNRRKSNCGYAPALWPISRI